MNGWKNPNPEAQKQQEETYNGHMRRAERWPNQHLLTGHLVSVAPVHTPVHFGNEHTGNGNRPSSMATKSPVPSRLILSQVAAWKQPIELPPGRKQCKKSAQLSPIWPRREQMFLPCFLPVGSSIFCFLAIWFELSLDGTGDFMGILNWQDQATTKLHELVTLIKVCATELWLLVFLPNIGSFFTTQ